MTRGGAIKISRILCIVFIVIGILSLCIGFNKILQYDNPENEYVFNDEYVNAYVKGDAYNYIINGTYFTAYAVIGTGSLIISSIMGGISLCLSIKSDEELIATEKLPEI